MTGMHVMKTRHHEKW